MMTLCGCVLTQTSHQGAQTGSQIAARPLYFLLVQHFVELRFKVLNERPDNEYVAQVSFDCGACKMILIDVYFPVFLLGSLFLWPFIKAFASYGRTGHIARVGESFSIAYTEP